MNGAWTVEQDGEVYSFDATGQGYASVPKGVSWDGDYAFKALYQLVSGTLVFSFDATQNGRYYVSITPELISLVKDDAADDRTVLTQAQAPDPAPDQQHYLAIAKKDGTIQVYVDRTLWLAYTDSSPFNVGTIVVGATEGTTGWVDDVFVHKIMRPLPQKTPAVAAVAPGAVQDVAPPDEDSLAALPASDADVPDLPADNQPGQVVQPTVIYFTGRPDDSGAQGASELSVLHGSTVIVEWRVQDASAVYVASRSQALEGSMRFIIEQDFDCVLEAVGWDGRTYTYHVRVDELQPEAEQRPDLSIQVSTQRTAGYQVSVTVTVSNNGQSDATEGRAYWYAHENNHEVTWFVPVNLPAGETQQFTFTHDYGTWGNMHWLGKVEVGSDLDESNNSARGTVNIPQ